MTADISELRALAKELRGAEGKVRTLVARAVKKTANDIQRDAAKLAPVDTGALRNSISSTIDPDGMGAEVGPTVNYGAFQEYGTARQAPQPFLNPAFERRTPTFEKACEQIVRKVIG